jgi:hypothetical protein
VEADDASYNEVVAAQRENPVQEALHAHASLLYPRSPNNHAGAGERADGTAPFQAPELMLLPQL